MLLAMTQSDKDQIFELLTLCAGLRLKQSALSLKVSAGRVNNFKLLSKNERKNLIEYLRQIETKKNLMWVMLINAFELEIIDNLAYISYQSNIGKISGHLIAAGVIEAPLSDLELPELERVLNHFRLLFYLTSNERLQKQCLDSGSIDTNKTKQSFMPPITEQQLKLLNTLFRRHKLTVEEIQVMILKFSESRTAICKDLFNEEATKMIEHLKKLDPCVNLRKKVFALAYEAKIIEGNDSNDKKESSDKLDKFLLDTGKVKKHLSKMTATELVKVVLQLEQIIMENNESSASKAAAALFHELNIPVQ